MTFCASQANFGFSGQEFVSKLIDGKFPSHNRVIPTIKGRISVSVRQYADAGHGVYRHS